MNLANLSIKRPVFATMLLALFIVLGFVSYGKMNVDEMPDASDPFVSVSVTYEGAQPEQVDAQVTQKIEEAVGEAKGVKHISSTSSEGSAVINIEFNLEVDASQATQDVRDKVSAIRDQLPTGIQEPVIARYDMKAAPVVAIAITSDRMTRREMSDFIKDSLKPRLQKVTGVGQLNISGMEEREIQLLINHEALNSFYIPVVDVTARLKQENQDVPGGKLKGAANSKEAGKELSVRTAGNFTNPQEFLATAIAVRGKVPISYGQIGTVKDTVKDIETLASFDGKSAITIEVGKQSGENAVRVANDVKQELTYIQKSLPPGMELHIVRDDAARIQDSIHEVWFDLAIGGLVAVAIVFLFLGDWRGTVISALAIPASIVAAFFFMKLANFSINTMSLMGLSLSVGLLIDDAIVVIENISRHKAMGKDARTAAVDGTKEIALAVVATTLTVVAVFVPVGFMTGMVGQYFKEFGLSIAFAVLVSLFISFTLTPMMAAIYLPIGDGTQKSQGHFALLWQKANKAFEHFAHNYAKWLTEILDNYRKKVLVSAALLFLLSLAIWPLLGSSFFPATDQAQFNVKIKNPPGISVTAMDEQGTKLSAMIQEIPEVTHVTVSTSQTEQSFFVKLLPVNQRSRKQKEIIRDVRQKLNAVPGVKVDVLEDYSKPVEISLTGSNLAEIGEAADLIKKQIEEIPGTRDVFSSYRPGAPNLSLHLNEAHASDLSVSTEDIGTTMQTLLSGTKVGKYSDNEDRVDIRVRLQGSDRSKPEMLSSVYIPAGKTDENGTKMLVPLSQVASLEYTTSPAEITRYDRRKEIRLTANLENTSLGEFESTFYEQFDEASLPGDVRLGGAGEAENMDEGFSSIYVALVLAIIFIFMILAAQFESYSEPFAIMLSLPLALIGALLGLFLAGSDLSITSLIGIMMLMGLVTKNAILLIDFAKKEMNKGVSCHLALADAGRIRLRPILMTSLAMIGGMIPIALGIGPGSEARAPMAHAIIGGLITSTMLTLVVVPVVYSLIYDLKLRYQMKTKTEKAGEVYEI